LGEIQRRVFSRIGADIIITSGAVLTLDEARPRAEAIAISGNRISHIGSTAEILNQQGAGTRVVDAGGGTAWANTTALEMAGILEGARLGPGNEIVMGADGLATGELREPEAVDPVRALLKKGDRDRLGLATGGEPDS